MKSRSELLKPKLENIISGHRINQDDADWLRALLYSPKDNATGAADLEQALHNLIESLQGVEVPDSVTGEITIAQEALERYDPSHTAALEHSLRSLNQEYERIYAALKQSQVSAPVGVHVMRNGELFWDISSPVFDACGRLIAGHITNGAWEVELDHQTTMGRVKGATDWFPIEDFSYVMVYPKELPEDPTEDNIPF